MRKIINTIKKIVVALCMLYTFNLIVSSIGIIIPINIYSIATVSILGLPAIFGLLLILQFI